MVVNIADKRLVIFKKAFIKKSRRKLRDFFVFTEKNGTHQKQIF